jgi:hypothetical protein
MRRTILAVVLACAPAYLAAQSEPSGTAGFSTDTRIRLDAMLRSARERGLPTEPMTDRIAEGQVKGVAEAQILAATQRVKSHLEASQQALIQAGHPQPSGGEVANGAQLIARGASSAQLEAFASQVPSEHRLEVAFAVLTELAARGVPVDHALSVVGAKLHNGASESSLLALTASGNGSLVAQQNRSSTSQAGESNSANSSKGSLGKGLAGTLNGNVAVGIGRKP